MWKFINSVIIVFAVFFGVSQSIFLGHLVDIPWTALDFISAPFIFGAMVLVGHYIYKRILSNKEWKTPSFNTNLFSQKNPLNMPFSLSCVFFPVGLGFGGADFYLGREINEISIMFVSISVGVFCAGLISIKLFSESS